MSTADAEFASPGAACRGKPFWAWNGKLEADELRRQVQIMHRMGLGGFFMHSRVGLATPYLADEWFEMVRACVDEARKLGMEAWLYDEDRWPSGAAGGLVTVDPRFRHRELRMEVCEPGQRRPEGAPLALFSAVVEGVTATHVRRLGPNWDGTVEPAGARLLVFTVKADEPSSWFNDQTYLDTMNHEAVRRFIEVTHAAYRREIGGEFGRVVPGIFTDEPHHGACFSGGWEREGEYLLPWTDRLPQVFRERYGYDILDHLPELFLNVDGRDVSQPRWHYHDCKTFLFVDAFSRQIGEWCGKAGLLFTGHVLEEAGLVSQARQGGAALRFYEFMQAPGIDQLTEHWEEYTTAKQCSSVQHQMGRRWMLSELYGCTGWDWPFEGHKSVGDWQAALGVNLRCPHLSWYTMAGEAKRDYPASIFFQSPWWEHYGKVEDYYARIGAAMSRGEAVRRLLVVHPVESVWARATPQWHSDPRVRALDEGFQALIRWLLYEHVDFDYGDEDIMARHGAVADGVLKVVRADYDVVLVPPVDTLRSSTLELLRRFRQAGGEVVFCEPLPAYADAKSSQAPARLAGECTAIPFERAAVAAAVEKARVVSVRDEAGAEKTGVLYLLHREGDELRLFLCNRDRQKGTGPLTVSVKGAGKVQMWDAESGTRWGVASRAAKGWVRFAAEMPPTGSRLFVVTPRAERLRRKPQLGTVRSTDLADHAWTSELTDHNVFVLDRPEFRVGEGAWQGPLEILKADGEIRRAIGLHSRGGGMVQPWARPKVEGPRGRIGLRYRFTVEQVPGGDLFLAVENPGYFRITLNGRAVPAGDEAGWWVDPCLHKLPLPAGALRAGVNELVMDGTMDDDCDLEACFLLGAFAVEVEGARARIMGLLGRVGFGDWTAQGLPFYTGSVMWRTTVEPGLSAGERLVVEVPEFGGACVRVLVDGREAGIIGWQPHEVDVTELVRRRKRVELGVEVLSHRRNAFGPLHNAEARPQFVGPHSFVTTGKQWQDAYSLVPAGCLAAPRLRVCAPQRRHPPGK